MRTYRPYKWRKTGPEYDRDAIIRALRRDLPNVGKWRRTITGLADAIEKGEVLIVRREAAPPALTLVKR